MASVLTVPQVKDHLNISVNTHNAELQIFIDAAEAALEELVGPLQPKAKAERVRGCSGTLVLATLPVVSLTTVTPVGGSPLTVTDLYVDADSGVITMLSNGTFTSRAYDVAYSAGRATCPPDLLLAVKELVRHLWRTQRGPGGPATDQPPAGFALPNRVLELIGPHMAVVI